MDPKRILFNITSVILILCHCRVCLYSAENPPAGEYSAESILSFTRFLISGEEYYRARVELHRLGSYYPDFIGKERLFVSDLFLMFKMHDYNGILSKDILAGNESKLVSDIFKTDAFIENLDFVRANSLIMSAGMSGIDDIDLYIFKRMILTGVLINKIDETRRIIENRNIDFEKSGYDVNILYDSIKYGIETHDSLKYPCKAALFGAVPGMGYVYSEEFATGIIAFILISSLTAAAYYSFKTDNKPIGVFIGASAAFFYGGSIMGGYMSAKRYNDAIIRDMSGSLSSKMGLDEDRDNIFKIYGADGGR